MTLATDKTTGDKIQPEEWNEAATRANTVESNIDQDVKTTASPTFAGLNSNGDILGDGVNPYLSLTTAGGSAIGYNKTSNNYNMNVGGSNIRLRQNFNIIAEFDNTSIDFNKDLNVNGDCTVTSTADINTFTLVGGAGGAAEDTGINLQGGRYRMYYDGATGTGTISSGSGKNLALGANGSINSIYINTSEEVGIGTTSPSAKLDIDAGIIAGTERAVIVSHSGGSAMKLVNTGTGGDEVSFGVSNTSYGTGANKFYITPTDSSTQAQLTLDLSTGNFGVGTISPTEKLEINGNTYLTNNHELLLDNTNNNKSVSIRNRGTNAATMEFDALDDFIFLNGNVGIGTTSPDYKLDVNGSFGFTPGTSVTPVDNGDVVIEFTNNTTLTFKAKGTDGTVRSATLTLS